MKKIYALFSFLAMGAVANAQCTPSFTSCPTNVSTPVDSGQCTAVVNYTTPVFTGCANGTLVQTSGLASGSAFPLGVTTNTYEVYGDVDVFTEDFSDNLAGWTLGPEWQIGPAVAGSCPTGNDPGTDNTPTADNGIAGVVIGGCASTAQHGMYYLTSPVINTAGMTNLNFSYYRWLTSDYTPYMQNNVEVWNGSSWVVVWQSGGSPNIVDNSWVYQNFDISAYANANMQIRIGFNIGSSGVYTVGGWNVDDVRVYQNVGTGTTCSFTVDVANDTPVTTCPSNMQVTANAANCEAVVNYTAPIVTDCNYPTSSTLLSGMASGSVFPMGTTTVTYLGEEAPPVYFTEDFADNSAGWILGTEWQIGSATASTCGGNPDPGVDNTPTSDNGIAGVVIGGCATTALHGYYYITSPVINTAGASSLVLEFYRWLNSDYTPYMQNIIQVYDGVAWQTVWQSGGSPGITGTSWTLQSYNISAYANANMQVRWGHQIGSSGAFTRGSWNIDDVYIGEVPSSTVLLSSQCSFDIEVVSGLTANSTLTQPLCYDQFGSVVAGANGNVGPFTVDSLGNDLNMLGAGWSSFMMTDSIGCMVMDSVEVVMPDTLSAVLTYNDPLCSYDLGDASVAMAGGTGSLSINWNTGDTTTSVSGLAAGTYDYTVVDSNGCMVSDTFDIVAPVTTSSATSTDEIAGNDGTIDLTVTGFAAPVTFDWSNGATTEDLSGLAGGTYTVVITDANGCADTLSVTVNSQLGISEMMLAGLKVYPNPNKGQFAVTSANAAILSVHVIDQLGRTIEARDGVNANEVIFDLARLAPGSYQVMITTELGTAVKSIVIQ